MAFSSSAIAQVNSSSTNVITPARLTNQLESGVEQENKDNIEGLENSSIKYMTVPISKRKKSLSIRIREFKNQSPNRSLQSDTFRDFTALTAQDILQLGLELPQLKSQSCNVSSDCIQTRQISQVPAPTFNQLLNLQLPQQQSDDTETVLEKETLVPLSIQQSVEQKQAEQEPQEKRKPLREPSLRLQGVYVNQGGDTSARGRVTGIYPLTPQSLFGGTLDLTSEDNSFDDSRGGGLNINELYFATSLKSSPNLRFVVGQMDLTSYFDRNSFAKDGTSHFFNPVFQTNPALSSTGIGSRPGLLVNWSATDNIIAKAAVFSSSQGLSDFSLDGFAGEVGIRYGNAIIRGTYSTAKDAGNRDSFAESFGIARGELYLDGDRFTGVTTELGVTGLRLELDSTKAKYSDKALAQKDLDKMQTIKPAVGLVLSKKLNNSKPSSFVAEIEAVEQDETGKITIELKFPDKFKDKQLPKIKQLLEQH